MAVVLSFLLFLVWNGSIVVGDKAHHTACLHLPQLLYFSSFSALFAGGQLVINQQVILEFLCALRKPATITALSLALLCSLAAVHYYT